MNKQIIEKLGITDSDYINYCKKNNKPYYLISTKSEFFKKIQEGKLIKNKKGDLLEKK